MAQLRERKLAGGKVSYLVQWRQGGRNGTNESETLSDKKLAESFKLHVDAAGNRWPVGWTKGYGWGTPESEDEHVRLVEFGHEHIENATRPGPDTKDKYTTQLTTFVKELDEILDNEVDRRKGYDGIITVESVTEDHIKRWINWRLERGFAPKTISNYHGLLYQVFEAAKNKELRKDNPCEGHKLPDRNTVDADSGEANEIHFLTPEQWAIIRNAMFPDTMYRRGQTGYASASSRYVSQEAAGRWAGTIDDRLLIEGAVLTGMRWGEITALRVKDVYLSGSMITQGRPYVQVLRAWKRNPKPGSKFHKKGFGQFYIGRPKTKKSRRKISLSPLAVEIFRKAVADKKPNDLVFQAPLGGAQLSATWYEGRWQKALDLAVKRGLNFRPRFHDLRHTHVAWLIAANTSLPDIQARLGHESIVTTIDVYGGLLMNNDDVMHTALDHGVEGKPIPRITAATNDPLLATPRMGAADEDPEDADLPEDGDDLDDVA